MTKRALCLLQEWSSGFNRTTLMLSKVAHGANSVFGRAPEAMPSPMSGSNPDIGDGSAGGGSGSQQQPWDSQTDTAEPHTQPETVVEQPAQPGADDVPNAVADLPASATDGANAQPDAVPEAAAPGAAGAGAVAPVAAGADAATPEVGAVAAAAPDAAEQVATVPEAAAHGTQPAEAPLAVAPVAAEPAEQPAATTATGPAAGDSDATAAPPVDAPAAEVDGAGAAPQSAAAGGDADREADGGPSGGAVSPSEAPQAASPQQAASAGTDGRCGCEPPDVSPAASMPPGACGMLMLPGASGPLPVHDAGGRHTDGPVRRWRRRPRPRKPEGMGVVAAPLEAPSARKACVCCAGGARGWSLCQRCCVRCLMPSWKSGAWPLPRRARRAAVRPSSIAPGTLNPKPLSLCSRSGAWRSEICIALLTFQTSIFRLGTQATAPSLCRDVCGAVQGVLHDALHAHRAAHA